MSAQLVVNTRDGVCWTRRTVTSGGIALYAPESVKTCPRFVMATIEELAEHGIVGSADALPMPVSPEPRATPVDADHAKAPWGRGEDGRPLLPMGAHWTDVPELVDRETAKIQGRVDGAQSGHWYDASLTETWRAPGTVCTRVGGAHRTVGRFTGLLPGDLDMVLHAHADLTWLLEMVAKFRARVAELEAERHSTNEALSEAAEQLRVNRDRITELEARLAEREQPADTYPSALPWARLMDAEDLADFLDELAASAITHASAEAALTEVESTCGRWRVIAEAQHAHNTAPGPGADDVVPQVTKLRAVLAEDPARCLKVHPFSPRDGWRIICANCDHIRYAPCHGGGDR